MIKKYFKFLMVCLTLCYGSLLSAQGGADCSSAVVITPGDQVSTGPTGAQGSCNTGTAGEWYSYTAAVNGAATVASCFGGADTKVNIYDACGAANCIAGNDDACLMEEGGESEFASSTSWNTTAGTTYYIEWDDRWDTNGFDWTLELSEAVVVPGCAAYTFPADGAVDVVIDESVADSRITFTWELSAEGSPDEGVNVYLGTAPEALNLLGAYPAGSTSGVITGISYSTTYYWAMIPFNSEGEAADCAIFSFTTQDSDVPVPNCATLVTPTDGAIDVPVSAAPNEAVDFAWLFATDGEAATGGNFYIGTAPDALTFVGTVTSATEATPVDGFAVGTTYYWQLVPTTLGGEALDCPIYIFTTETPIGDPGCTDETACNYDPSAGVDDGSCYVIGDACDDEDPATIGDVYVSCDLCEGVTEVFPGCTDEEACNYNAAANSDDGSCYAIGDACDDEDPATIGDVYVSCDLCEGETEIFPGCTDEEACNYNAAANSDDGSCFSIGDACDDEDPLTIGDVYVTCDLCEGVTEVFPGCTDEAACNYNANATEDDGSCIVPTGCDFCFEGELIDNPEVGDTCDDGNELTSNDVITSCDGDCAGVIDPVLGCIDATACNYDEAANSDDGSCTYALGCDVCVDGVVIDNPEIGEACDDGNVDTENDIILEDCSCAGTSIDDCDDENACTIDTMNDAGECVYTDVDCDDGNACTTDSCDPATGCVFTDVVCDDGDSCTTDSCDSSDGCIYTAIDCDDGDACTIDSCDSATGCLNIAIDCNDDNPLTTDSCDPVSGCVYIDVFCDDGNACTTDAPDPETGECVYADVNCDDGDACTTDTCDPATGCVYTEVDCDDGDLCTIDSCDPVTGCVNTPTDCDDGDPLTADSCVEGICVNTPIGDCDPVSPTIWGTGPWTMSTNGTFVAESSNDAVLAKGDGDLFVEVFLGECEGTSIGIFSTVGAGTGSQFIERIVVGDLVAGQTYSYSVTGGTNIMSKVKTYANGRLRDDECPGTRELSEKIHALRENQMYTNPAVQVTGFTFRFEDLADGDVFVAVRNTVDGHSPQLSAISGLESGHTYSVKVAHRVLQVANGMVAELYSDYGSSCTLTIGEGVTPVLGCTDASACNYNVDANTNDGTCYSVGDACDDGNPETANEVYVSCDVCQGEPDVTFPGCTDAEACNYNADANDDDGSCYFIGDACDDEDPDTSGDVWLSCGLCEGETEGPGNDLCANSTAIACGETAIGSTADATADADIAGCTIVVNTAPGVWFTIVGNGDVTEVNTNGSLYDTKMGVYGGTCDALECIETDDDDGDGLRSLVTFTAEAGTTYYIYVTGFSSAAGDYTLNVSCAPALAGCTDAAACNYNDAANSDDGTCVSAEGCDTCSGETDGTGTVVDNPDIGDACDDGDAGTENDMIVDCNECAGTIIGEILGCIDVEACNYDAAANTDDGSCGFPGDGCDDGDAGTANDTYGDDCVCAGLATPANDLCSGATAIGCGETATGSTAAASTDADIAGCTTAVNTAPGVWYTLVGTGLQITVNTDGSAYDTKMGVYSGSCDDLTCIETDDDDGAGLQSQVVFLSDAGVTYYVYVTGFSANAGDYVLNVECLTDAEGCTDAAACNYNSSAGVEDGSCVFAEGCDTCSGEIDGTGTVVDNPEVGDACDDGNPDTTGDVIGANCICSGSANNQTCASAEAIGEGTFTAAAPNGGAGASLTCQTVSGTLGTNAVWYAYTASFTGDALITSCLGGQDTRVSVFAGTCDDLGDCIASDDDTCPFAPDGSGSSYAAEVIVSVTAGETYLIEWDDRWTDGGFEFSISDLSPGAVDTDNQGGSSTSLSAIGTEMEIKAVIFPNPNTGENVNVTLSNLNDADEMVTIEVMDVYGKKVYSETYAINGSTMRQELVFNNDLASGLYLVQISANGQSVTQKLTIK